MTTQNFEGYTEQDNHTHTIIVESVELGNGYDKYSITHDGKHVQSGVVVSGKAQAQVNAYCKRVGITSLFVA